MREKQPTVSINVRFPPDVAEALKRLAAQDARSLNGEIVWALRAFIQRRAAEPKEDKYDDQDRTVNANR